MFLSTLSSFVILGLLAIVTFPSASNATSLTYSFAPNEESCFYAMTDQPGKKIGFYFAVQQGGEFDINFEVKGPRDNSILNGAQERQGDYVFTATDVGEYSFCFSNDMSTFAEKLVDFEITVENQVRPEFQKDGKTPAPALTEMEEILYRLSGSLTTVARNQRYFRTREHRNAVTVTSTHNRMYWFSLLESAAIISIAALQTFVVKGFFNVKKGGV
ncbi:emp24/gp25L/p24 family/GOLD-domain-containing protein [Sporodiniella umbellata]|nr:emp24/gp25L/p24 family/GOLD-domain-containing protein [Sporodiniella umbellata]